MNQKIKRIAFSSGLGLTFFGLACYVMALKDLEHLMDPNLIAKGLKKQANDYVLTFIALAVFAIIQMDKHIAHQQDLNR